MLRNMIRYALAAVAAFAICVMLATGTARADFCDDYYYDNWVPACNGHGSQQTKRECWEKAAQWYADCRSGNIYEKIDDEWAIKETQPQ